MVETKTVGGVARRLRGATSLAHAERLHSELRDSGLDRLTFLGNCLIDLYANLGCPSHARAAFDRLPNPNVFSWNLLIKAYARNASLSHAFHAFLSAPLRDLVTWNAIISAFSQHGRCAQALHLFYQMREEGLPHDKITFISALDACTHPTVCLHHGSDIHASVVCLGYEQDVLVGTSILHMYGKRRSICDARCTFEKLLNRDVAAWNAMINMFAQAGKGNEAIHYFERMLVSGFAADHISFISVLDGCVTLEQGQVVHATVVDSKHARDVEVNTALFSMYGKHGSLHHANHVFDRITCKTAVVWNAMIAIFSQNNRSKDALRLYRRMHQDKLKPDKSTFTTVLDACAKLAAVEEGQDVHKTVVCIQDDEDIPLRNSLISFYGECGGIWEARAIFEKMQVRDEISWTAIITACVQNGHNMEALRLFQFMQLEGFKPDGITFVSVLTGCGRSGLLEEGLLDDAEEMIENVPSHKIGTAWLSLLGACRIHADVERGIRAAENCVKLIPGKVLSYILLSNMYTVDEACTSSLYDCS